MKNTNHKWANSLILLVLLVGANSSYSQTTTVPETERVVDTNDIKAEMSEISSNVRDSVNENLDTLHEDLESAAQQESEAINQTSEPNPEQQISPDQVKPEPWWNKFKAVPDYLQSVPDRVPWIRERGLVFFGRAELDVAYYSSGITKSDSGFRIRSLRAGLAKAFEHNISVKAEIDLTDGNNNFSDLYLRYSHKRFGILTVGNQRVAQTLVNQTSRLSRPFMEEPLPAEAFGLGRRLALGWDMHKKKGGAHVTLFGRDLNGSIGDSGYAGRIYLNPTRTRFSVFHIGGSYVSENMSRKTRFFAHPESRVTEVRFVDTELFDDVDRQQIAGLEIAGAKDNLMFLGEFYRAIWSRNNTRDTDFKGFYVQARWLLTGETFKYTQGKFIRIRPQNTSGAWELAARLSAVNLNDEDVLGGKETNVTIAMNWYAPGNQFRVMSNLIFVRTDDIAGDENPIIFQVRAQFHW